MITGAFRGSGVAATVAGAQTGFSMIAPDKTPANLAAISAEAKRWRATTERYRGLFMVGTLAAAVSRRAQFAEEVLATIASNVSLGVCCAVLALDSSGRLLGAISYGYWAPAYGAMNLLAIDPENLAGSPGASQLRGVGNSLVAAAATDLLAHGTETVYLHPFDAEAAEYWMRRGFIGCGKGGIMCIKGRDKIMSLARACLAVPCGTESECLLCGTLRQTAPVRLPAYR